MHDLVDAEVINVQVWFSLESEHHFGASHKSNGLYDFILEELLLDHNVLVLFVNSHNRNSFVSS